MLLEMLFLAGLGSGSAPASTQPVLAGFNLTPDGGFCSLDSVGSSAKHLLQWTVSNINPSSDTDYELRIFESGFYVLTLSVNDTSWLYDLMGLVENGNAGPTERTFSYEIQLIRKLDSAVVQSLTTEYTAIYGGCR